MYLGSFDLGVQAARAHDIMALCNHGGAIYPGAHNALNFPPMLYAELLPFLGALSQVSALLPLPCSRACSLCPALCCGGLALQEALCSQSLGLPGLLHCSLCSLVRLLVPLPSADLRCLQLWRLR